MNVKLNLKKEIKTAFEPPLTDALPTAGPGLPHCRAPRTARSPTAGRPTLPGTPHRPLPHRRAPHIAGRPALPSSLTARHPALPVALLCPALRPHLTAARASGAERIALALSTPSPPRVGPGRASCVCFTLFHIVSPPVFVSRPFVVSLYRCSLHPFPALPWDSRSPQTTLWPPCGRATGFGLGCGCVSGV